MFTETGEFGCPVVGSSVGAQPNDGESLSFAGQLDLVDTALTVSTAAADTLQGVFPVTSELPWLHRRYSLPRSATVSPSPWTRPSHLP